MNDLVNKIAKYSKGGFTMHQVEILGDIARLIHSNVTTISKIQKYLEEHPDELEKNFGDMKLYAVINRIRKLKGEMK